MQAEHVNNLLNAQAAVKDKLRIWQIIRAVVLCFKLLWNRFISCSPVITPQKMSFNTKSPTSGELKTKSQGGSKLRQLMHNDTERKRKKRMIEMIDKIVDLLPMKCIGKTSRICRLEQLHSYILELRNKNDGLMFANPNSVQVQEILQLKKYIEHLENVNRNYLRLLTLAGISSASAIEMGDRDWKKPMKYSNKVFIDKKNETVKMSDLIEGKGSKDTIDADELEDGSSDEDDENKSSVTNGMVQLLNPLPLQPAQLQHYVLLSTGPNTPAQLVPICSTPIVSNTTTTNPTVFLGSNLTAAQISLTKGNQDNSSVRAKSGKKSVKTKLKTIERDNDQETSSHLKSDKTLSPTVESSLTTTIEKCHESAPENTEKNTAIKVANADNLETTEVKDSSEGQNVKRDATSVETASEESNSKKTKTIQSVQLTNSSSTQAKPQVIAVTDGEKATMTRQSMTSNSPIVYQVEDESNDSRLDAPDNAQSAGDKSAPANTTPGRCNYSTESLLQPPSESQPSIASQSNSESTTNTLNQSSQSNQASSYHQQNQSAPSFTVKDSLINSNSAITSNSLMDKHTFDLNSPLTSLCTSAKRNLPFDISELGISNTSSTPNIFDSTLGDNQQQQLISSFVPSWPTEASTSHAVSSAATNTTSGSQSYTVNANPSSVLFTNQPPFSLLPTTTPFDGSVPNVFGASPHKPSVHSNNSSSAFNFMPDLSSYSLASNEDQHLHNHSSTSIGNGFSRSSRTANSTATTTVASSRTQNNRNGTANNTPVSSSSSASYGKSKASLGKTSTAATSGTRNTKSSASHSKKGGSAKSSSSTTSTSAEPKCSQATSMSSASTTANLFHRHHNTAHGHPPHRPLPNESFPYHLPMSDPISFLSVTSVAGHSTSVMSSSSAPSAPPAFHPHPHAHHHSHQFAHASYSNFFTSSQADQSTGGLPSYDNRSGYEGSINSNDTAANDLPDHSQLGSYPIFRPQSQTSHSFAAATTTTTSSSYQAGSSASSTSRNFNPPPMYPHHHASSSSHVTNFNIGCLLPDSTLNSPGSVGYGTSEFLSPVSKSQTTKSTASSTSTSATIPSIVANSGLSKFSQMQLARPLPSVSSSLVDPLSASAAYQNTCPATVPPHPHHQYHPAAAHPFYPPPPPPPSQTPVTYSSSHPLNAPFASSSSNQGRNSSRSNSGFMATEELETPVAPSSSTNARSTSLTGHHYYPIGPHNSGVDMFNTSVGSTNQSVSHSNQTIGAHHLGQHGHFPPPNAPSSFNQISSTPTSVPNFNIQNSINTSSTATAGRIIGLHF